MRLLPTGHRDAATLTQGDYIDCRSTTVTAEMIDAFANMTGDRFEIHMSDEAAQRHGFGARLAFGRVDRHLHEFRRPRPATQDGLRQLHCRRRSGSSRHDLIDDAELQRLFGCKHFTEQRHVSHASRAETPDGTLRAGSTGNNAKTGLRSTDLHFLLCDAKVRAGSQLQSAVKGVPVQNGNDRLTQSCQGVEGRMPVANPVPTEPLRALRRPSFDVSTGGERLALTRKNDDPNVVVLLDLPATRCEIVHHGCVQHIQLFRLGNPKTLRRPIAPSIVSNIRDALMARARTGPDQKVPHPLRAGRQPP